MKVSQEDLQVSLLVKVLLRVIQHCLKLFLTIFGSHLNNTGVAIHRIFEDFVGIAGFRFFDDFPGLIGHGSWMAAFYDDEGFVEVFVREEETDKLFVVVDG